MITVEQTVADLEAALNMPMLGIAKMDPAYDAIENAIALLRQQSILEQRNVALREALVVIAQLNPDDGPTVCEIAESALAEVPQK